MEPELHLHVIGPASCSLWAVSLASIQLQCLSPVFRQYVEHNRILCFSGCSTLIQKLPCCLARPVAGAHSIKRQDG
ncbi:hypothetical protein BDV40DRAFT_270076 [Aspergillus tamarii]|uniref:Uncharacterized protein n=1 Tax=Aspergillus tamarii TaxID=41984 RepID=A0A5N6UQ38_ASPTM|nr:hypothetical protein BDV40DRAFT_270076 [Aspergillus tamarii]